MKFFTDHHIPAAVATQLQARGILVVRCEDVGLKDADDEALLAYAVEHGLTVLSLDADMARLHQQWLQEGRSHNGIFYGAMREFQGQVGSIVRFCSEWAELIDSGAGSPEQDIHNQLIYIKK